MLDRILNLQDRTRLIVMAVMTVIILSVINFEIAGKERIVRNGKTVLLKLAPRDPRSLMQGDYMALRYSMASAVATEAGRNKSADGIAVIQLDELNGASFVAVYEGQPLESGQHLLRYRKRGDSVRLASDAYFFEEGQWEVYSSARFGEIRVNADGDAVLTGLRDTAGKRLGPPLH
jgi:uncharacterized membrane-anchored protein